MARRRRALAAGLIAAGLAAAPAAAQELEPRSYSSLPVGVQFVALGVGSADGDLVFDPSLPVEDAKVDLRFAAAGYARTFALWGQVGKVGASLPWFTGQAKGLVAGEPAERRLDGVGDARVSVAWLFLGAPAVDLAAFARGPHASTVAGVTLSVTGPTGHYDVDRVLNVGTNRWSLKTEVGASHRIGRFWLEGAGAANLYSDNHEFTGSRVRSQDPVFSLQGHFIWEPRPRLWFGIDATYFWGGQVFVDGVKSGPELGNSKAALTASIPLGRLQSIKLSLTRGIATRTGANAQVLSAGWQYMLPSARPR